HSQLPCPRSWHSGRAHKRPKVYVGYITSKLPFLYSDYSEKSEQATPLRMLRAIGYRSPEPHSDAAPAVRPSSDGIHSYSMGRARGEAVLLDGIAWNRGRCQS